MRTKSAATGIEMNLVEMKGAVRAVEISAYYAMRFYKQSRSEEDLENWNAAIRLEQRATEALLEAERKKP